MLKESGEAKGHVAVFPSPPPPKLVVWRFFVSRKGDGTGGWGSVLNEA